MQGNSAGFQSPLSDYRPDIDGLRAVAVLAVIFFHAGISFDGGFVGVDLFFVISGYLITGIISKKLSLGKFSILDFYVRRVRRIFPALTLMVVVVLVAGWFYLLPHDYKLLARSAYWQSQFLANVHFWKAEGYFAQESELKPLLHTWSLAVEEQFYVLFPPLLWLLHRFAKRATVWIILLIFCTSLGACVYGSYHFPSATFYPCQPVPGSFQRGPCWHWCRVLPAAVEFLLRQQAWWAGFWWRPR
jgi:peptidoglycan/LPS O-acetylase OafA/YrhL